MTKCHIKVSDDKQKRGVRSMIKQCRNCREEFEPTRAQIDRYDWQCYSCRADARGTKPENRRGPMVYKPRKSKKWSSNREYQRYRSRKKNKSPEQVARKRARTDAYLAVKRGELKKLPCEICGKERVEAHHEDYKKPLQVRWLCRRHHLQLHSNQG